MKLQKKYKIIFIGLSIVLIAFIFLNREKISYAIATKDFEEVQVENLNDIAQSEESFFVYIGRETCPFCRMFVSELSSAADNTNKKIYYIDSEDRTNTSLNQFREDNEIVTVPTLVKVTNKKIEAILESGLTDSEITKFLLEK